MVSSNEGKAGFRHLSFAEGTKNRLNGFSSRGNSTIKFRRQLPKWPLTLSFEYFIIAWRTVSQAYRGGPSFGKKIFKNFSVKGTLAYIIRRLIQVSRSSIHDEDYFGAEVHVVFEKVENY